MSGLFAFYYQYWGYKCHFWSTATNQPVQALMEGTVSVGKGDFASKVHVKSQDELGVLSDSFNYMSDEIMKYMEEVKEKTRMEGVRGCSSRSRFFFFQNKAFPSDSDRNCWKL